MPDRTKEPSARTSPKIPPAERPRSWPSPDRPAVASDEVFFFASVAQVNGRADDTIKYYRSGTIGDVDRNEDNGLTPAVESIGWDNYKEEFRVKVAPRGKVVITVRMYESDNESEAGHTEYWNQFRTGLNEESFLDVAGRTVAADWNPGEIEVFGFKRGDIPEAGYVLPATPVGEIVGGAQRIFGLDWGRTKPLVFGSTRPISQWRVTP